MSETTTKARPDLRHEDFCLPRPGERAPRVESYIHLVDEKDRPNVKVTRCVECGATRYEQKEK